MATLSGRSCQRSSCPVDHRPGSLLFCRREGEQRTVPAPQAMLLALRRRTSSILVAFFPEAKAVYRKRLQGRQKWWDTPMPWPTPSLAFDRLPPPTLRVVGDRVAQVSSAGVTPFHAKPLFRRLRFRTVELRSGPSRSKSSILHTQRITLRRGNSRVPAGKIES